MRLIVSRERCYDRMNAGFLARQRAQWEHCAAVIVSLHRIHQAKQLLKTYREQRAARKIAELQTLRQLRHDAQNRLRWLQKKRRAKDWGAGRERQWLTTVWHHWQTFTRDQRARRAAIIARLEHGQREWLTTKATRLQTFFRRTQQVRATLENEIVPRLHPVLMQLIDQAERAVSTTADLSDRTVQQQHFEAFYELMKQYMRTWREPTAQHELLAKRYGFELERLPLERIWRWLRRQARRDAVLSGWSLDLRASPRFTVRALRFLDRVSHYWELYDRVQWQCDRLETQREATFVARDYLVQLYRHELVRSAPIGWSSLSAAQRLTAVQLLRQANEIEALSSSSFEDATAFTTFHSVWTDLCERCLVMCADDGDSKCSGCGHRRYARSTAAQSSVAPLSPPRKPTIEGAKGDYVALRWVDDSERPDFLVIHAYLHALAPRRHPHRELFTLPSLWKAAMAKAFDVVAELYDGLGITTLDAILDTMSSQQRGVYYPKLAELFPRPVFETMERIATAMMRELERINRELLSGSSPP
ncbi:hypothetical protein PINS_up004555 [Pythium insidiosum]|nr:hypothetical protein PINS_up004555 [Pythium insidiosum]